MKVQVYRENGLESYDAILVSTGDLYDPTYEVMLKNEKKLTKELPFLALPVDEMKDDKLQKKISRLVKGMKNRVKKHLSEIILDKSAELTIILSINGFPASVFLGISNWKDKLVKLDKIIGYMISKRKIPAIINMTNSKKVVVKFNDKF